MSLTTTEINALRDYAEESGTAIVTRIMEEEMTRRDLTPLEFKDTYRHDIGDSTEVIQTYQKTFTPKGGVSIKPRIQRHEVWKGDMEFEPRKHNAKAFESYLARTGNDPYELPYYQFIIEQVTRQIVEDMEIKQLWQGVALGVIAQAPNPAQDVVDGFLKKLQVSAYAGEIPVFATGPLTYANASDEIESFVKGSLQSPTRRAQAWNLYCSVDMLDKFQQSYRANHGAYVHADEFGNTRVQGTNVTLKPQAGLLGNELILAQQQNMFFGYDGDMSFIVEKDKRQLFFLIDGKISVDYATTQEIYINEHAMIQP